MRILITGGAGFIGSNFLYYMREAYPAYELTCYDSLTYAGNLQTLQELFCDPLFHFVKGDITERAQVDQLFKEHHFDAVVHFAAESHVDRSIADPMLFLHTNVMGTGVLLEACRRYGIKRFHQVSTDEVYGDLPREQSTNGFTEQSPLRGSSPYAASKAAADLLVLSYFRTYGLPVTISRCSNNYGRYQFPEKLIPMIILRALQDKTIPLHGDGKDVRDWIEVGDHCRAINLILHHGTVGEVYNIGANCELSNLTVVEHILQELGKEKNPICHVADRPGHDRRYALDCTKLREEFGWRPTVAFAQGIAQTVDWYRTHSAWWKEILSRIK